MQNLKKLFEQNKRWAEKVKVSDPEFFSKLSKHQNPEYLWIGCSDSRVPANQIVDVLPGQLFVHRNIANLVVSTDLSCLSVIQYAVEVLQVKHIIVCGHYGCGGVQAAWEGKNLGLMDDWLQHIKKVLRQHQTKIDAYQNEEEKINLLCELNVAEQVANVSRTPFVQNAWQSGQKLAVHGWMYNLESGLIEDLNISVSYFQTDS